MEQRTRELDISIHAPVKGATRTGSLPYPGFAISIHAPVKGATLWARKGPFLSVYFNPRSREGSDPCNPSSSTTEPISIHAPVKGATTVSCL